MLGNNLTLGYDCVAKYAQNLSIGRSHVVGYA